MEGLPPKEERFFSRLEGLWEKTPKFLKVLLFSLKWLAIGAIFYLSIYGFVERFDIDIKKYQESSLSDSGTETSSDTEDCNVLGINLHGTLLTYIPPNNEGGLIADDTDIVSSESILYFINQANEDENIKSILIEVDSYGGSPVAGEEVANALKASTKPTVGLIRQAGTSAAYLAISSAGHIFASKNSDVGGIGVTSSYLSNVGKNQKEGYGFIQLSAGKYKDMGNPDKPLTDEERALIIRDLNIIHQNFINDVSVNRNLPIENIKRIADGSSVLGEKAKELGLIDEIGGIIEVEKYLSEKIGEEVEICWN
ncbi:MAG: S49 family peptidase [bacterium]|nr:S49 family peptidase [bacterium]